MGSDEEDDLVDPASATDEQNAAATKIQAMHRGKKGRKRHKKKKDEDDQEEQRKTDNPKLGDKKGQSTVGGVGGIADKGAAIGDQGLELMLQMFGKDGGAYLRKSEQRSMRDMPMCFSLAMYWACMIFIYFNAEEKGNIDMLFYPVTFEGVSCGVRSSERDLTEYKAIYYPNPTLPELNFCVKECPGKGTPGYMDLAAPFSSYVCHHDIELKGRYEKPLGGGTSYADDTCEPMPPTLGKTGATCNWLNQVCGGGDPDKCEPGSKLKNLQCRPSATCGDIVAYAPGTTKGAGKCYHPIGRTQNILYQCLPLELAENATEMLKEMSGDMGSQHFLDLQEFGWVCGVAFGVALVCSFVWVLFLDYFAGPLIWFTVYASVIMCPVVGTVLLYQSGKVPLPDGFEIPPEAAAAMKEVQVDPQQIEIAAYCCYALTFVLLAIFIIFKDRITLSIGVIEEASDCFLSLPKVVFLPIITFVLELPLVTYFVYSSLYILSMRTYEPDDDRYVYNEALRTMLAFNAFGCMWTGYLLTSIQYTTIAGACSDWYYTFEKDGEREVALFSVERSLWRTMRYSLGTMIFGSLLISVVVVAKWIATYFINQVMAQSPENKVIQMLGHCLICVVSCIEKFVRFLGRLAYIECAIYGCNFCTGIYKASKRLLKNIVRFAFLSVFAHLMVFLGKVGVVVATVLICQIIMQREREAEGDAAAGQSQTPYLPLAGCGLAATVTVLLFMGVYETAIDTIMVCFLEDEAENDASGKPSFASGELAGFMKNTKSISDAAEQYMDDSRQAKTNRIRADDETHEKLKNDHPGMSAKKGRSAKERKKAKQEGGDSKDAKYTNPINEDDE